MSSGFAKVALFMSASFAGDQRRESVRRGGVGGVRGAGAGASIHRPHRCGTAVAVLQASTFAFLLLGTSLHAEAPTIAIRGATVIDVTDGSLQRDQTVLVEGSRITAVGPVAEVAMPTGAEVLEASGDYVVPGLWDMHVHAMNQEDVRTYLTLFLANGITGYREPWGSREAADSARAAIAGRRLAEPARQEVAGALCTTSWSCS